MITTAKVRFVTGILICAVLIPGWAQSERQGSAAVGRPDEFPADGLYAASSAFPLNSTVDVTNPATGERARVVVVREMNDPGVFMVVSESVAQELSLEPGDSTTLRATPVQPQGLTAVSPNEDLPFHPDPDVNPAATFGDPNAPLVFPPDADAPSVATATADADDAADADGTDPDREELVEITEPAETTEPETLAEGDDPAESPAEDSAMAESPDGDSPAVDDDAVATAVAEPPEPPSEDPEERSEAAEPVEPPTESVPVPLTELESPPLAPPEEADVRVTVNVPQPPEPPENPVQVRPIIPEGASDVDRVVQSESAPVVEPEEGEVALPLVAETERIAEPLEEPRSEEERLRPGMIPDDAIVSLVPADFRSPDPPPEPESEPESDSTAEADPAQPPEEPAEAPEPDPPRVTETEPIGDSVPDASPPQAESPAESLPLVERLDSGSAYVQVAAFTTPQSARQTIDSLSGGWPVAVMAQKNGDRSVYRVYVGPLAEDEKGSVLFRVRNQGFRDAFVR